MRSPRIVHDIHYFYMLFFCFAITGDSWSINYSDPMLVLLESGRILHLKETDLVREKFSTKLILPYLTSGSALLQLEGYRLYTSSRKVFRLPADRSSDFLLSTEVRPINVMIYYW